MNPKLKTFLEKCHEVVVFCRTRGKDCFVGWPQTTLLIYVCHHAIAGSLFVKRNVEGIVACGFAWPDRIETIRARFATCKPVFQWARSPQPDCIYVAEIIGEKTAFRDFITRARGQWPTFSQFVTFRRNKLVNLTPAIHRLEGK